MKEPKKDLAFVAASAVYGVARGASNVMSALDTAAGKLYGMTQKSQGVYIDQSVTYIQNNYGSKAQSVYSTDFKCSACPPPEMKSIKLHSYIGKDYVAGRLK